MSVAPGSRLGPYEIVSPLGQGGMGEVFRARDTRLDRAVALKVLPRHLAGDPIARARFEREAKAIAGLNHPNVCALFDVGQDQGQDFLVMELLEGLTLQERLLRGPMDIPQFVDVALALADALDAAHTQSLIHRDLKPANIFITTRGIPKILDFGLAKALDSGDDATRQSDVVLTGMGTTIGTVAYMSPEQLRGEPLDARTDLFSIGLVFYEMVTGQRAFTGATSAVISAAILGQEPAPPRTLRPDLSTRLDDIIIKALDKDRAMRYQSAADLRADLMRLKREGSDVTRIASASAMAPTATMPIASEPAPSSPQRSRRVPTLIALSAALTLACSAAAYWFKHRNPTAPPTSTSSAAQTPIPPSPPPTVSETPATSASAPSLPQAPKETTSVASQATAKSASPAKPPTPVTETPAPPATPPPTTALTNAGGARNSGRLNGPRGRAGRGLVGAAAGSTLVNRLRTLPPQPYHIVFAAGSPEAREHAMQLQALLNAAGWTSSGLQPTQEPARPGYLGVGVPHQTNAATALVNWATNNGFNPDYRIVQSLKEIHIVVGPPK